jgi:uncharacterized protein YegP (UPF0339 family)
MGKFRIVLDDNGMFRLQRKSLLGWYHISLHTYVTDAKTAIERIKYNESKSGVVWQED